MGIERVFRDRVRSHPKKTAVVYERQRVTYQMLDIRSGQVAGMLRDILGQEQKKVLILAHNSIYYLEVLLGCFKANMIACPVNWRLSPYELSTLLMQDRFELIFFDRASCALLQKALEVCDLQIEQIRLGGLKYESRIEFFSYDHLEMERSTMRRPSDVAIQYFTSGTTGIPKGVLQSHESLLQYVDVYSGISHWRHDAIYETSANLFHLSGFSCLISLLLGNTLVLMDHFSMDKFLTATVHEKVTRMSLVPTLITAILHDPRLSSFDLSRVEKIVYGGSAMLPSQIEAVSQSLSCGLEIAYGSTETCCISVLTSEDHQQILEGRAPERRLASVGRPLPGVHLRVEGEDGQELPPNEVGELTVKSPFLYSGYSGANVPTRFTSDGFHHTGDVGYIDEVGYVYIVDRKHDMIVCGGENIYPKEVEICIAKMANCVREVSVVGQPDPIWGEIVVAFVVPKEGATVTEEDIITFCKHNIASYKKPKRVFFVDALPLNSNGKVEKNTLRDWLRKKE